MHNRRPLTDPADNPLPVYAGQQRLQVLIIAWIVTDDRST
jgi:hypothetical protein